MVIYLQMNILDIDVCTREITEHRHYLLVTCIDTITQLFNKIHGYYGSVSGSIRGNSNVRSLFTFH